MKIKLTTCFSGSWSANAGDEIERPDAEAQRLIDAGFALPVKSPAKLEKATKQDKLETAIRG